MIPFWAQKMSANLRFRSVIFGCARVQRSPRRIWSALALRRNERTLWVALHWAALAKGCPYASYPNHIDQYGPVCWISIFMKKFYGNLWIDFSFHTIMILDLTTTILQDLFLQSYVSIMLRLIFSNAFQISKEISRIQIANTLRAAVLTLLNSLSA